jgi:hypothetical protein
MAGAKGPRDLFRESNLKAWTNALGAIFPNGLPAQKTWTDAGEIAAILNTISAPDLCFGFYPRSGGNDLLGAGRSKEPGCIELKLGSKQTGNVVKPLSLNFYSFPGEADEWAYFRLETKELAPSDTYDKSSLDLEELTEVPDGRYLERSAWDSGVIGHDESEREILLPKGSRLVVRFFKGSFAFFAKGSLYNRNTGTTDGRHDKMTAEQFKTHIREASEACRKQGE